MFAPVTFDPPCGAVVVPVGVPVAVVAAVVAVCVGPGVVDGGLVLVHPAIAMANTTRMITTIVLLKIFIVIPPDLMDIPSQRSPFRGW
jgi:hypothetical protein